jgi:hypothetical protein
MQSEALNIAVLEVHELLGFGFDVRPFPFHGHLDEPEIESQAESQDEQDKD